MKCKIENATCLIVLVGCLFLCTSCKESDMSAPDSQASRDSSEKGGVYNESFDIHSIKDTYASIAFFQFHDQWSVYNVHDPSIKKFGDYYYCYSTDVAYGTTVRPGIQVRRSKDLVEWHFMGWVFSGLPSQAVDFITDHGGTAFNGIWAPYVMKVGNNYRLYYALSSSTPRLSAIGLATSSSPLGPWKQEGLVVTSQDDNTTQTNAIDPSVVVTPSGEMWMVYGSAWDGIYILKLNPS